MNNLQALENLKKSAIEQSNELNNSIAEIHKQSLEKLNKDLKNTYELSLSSLQRNTKKEKILIATLILILIIQSIATIYLVMKEPLKKEIVLQQNGEKYIQLEQSRISKDNKFYRLEK